MAFITINQIIDVFRDIADRHLMINDFGNGPTYNIGAAKPLNFPYLWVENGDINTVFSVNGMKEKRLTFNLYLMDKINKGDDNFDEIISDTEFILSGIIQEFSQLPFYVQNKLSLFQDISMQPVVEETDDNVNGWLASIALKIPIPYTYCEMPILPYVIPTPPETCFPLSLINTTGCLFDTITECPEDKRIIIPDVRLVVNNSVEGFFPYVKNLNIVAPGATFSSFTEDCNGLSQIVLDVPDGSCFPINVVNSEGCLFEEITDCGDTCDGYTWQLNVRTGSIVTNVELLDCNGNVYKVEAGPFGPGTYQFCHGSETVQPVAVESGIIAWTQIGQECSFVTLNDTSLFDSNGSFGDFATPKQITITGSTILSATTSSDGCELNITVQGASQEIVYQRPIYTGQITEYRTGDAGYWQQQGAYTYNQQGILTKLDMSSASPFETLVDDNVFGTKHRFTADNGDVGTDGGLTYRWTSADWDSAVANGATRYYLIDHLTGLAYITVPISTGADGLYTHTWDNVIDFTFAFSYAGFSDWRPLIRSEAVSIINNEINTPASPSGSMIIFEQNDFFLSGTLNTTFNNIWLGDRIGTQPGQIRFNLTIQPTSPVGFAATAAFVVRNHFN
jgi:hypothetical protein